MEEATDLNRTELLIDFNSPVSKRFLDSPLIPVPLPPRQSLSVSPVNSNPFDVVERQIAPSDPFESAFQSAFRNTNNAEQNLQENLQTPNNSHAVIKSDSEKGWSTDNVRETNATPKSVCKKISVLNKDGNKEYVENDNNCGCLISAKSASVSVIVSEADSQSHISFDLETEEGLKAVIAKRVNKCIQKVLNNSLRSKLSSSNENLNCNGVAAKSNLNRRSLSFVMDSKKDMICDRLNKSCADSSSNNDHYYENHRLESPDASSLGLCDMDLLNFTSEEVNKTGESVLPPTENDLVFHEAKKLARTFSRIADSFCQDMGSENEDDLMSMKPRWLDSSSEDEEEKLRKDPALNIRVNLTPVVPSRPDSTALSAYKSRARRSMSPQRQQAFQLQDDPESETKAQSRLSFPPARRLKPEAPPKPPSIASVAVPANLVNPDTKSIRLKKNTAVDIKRGPMRAVMPIQSMTKEVINSEAKALANCNISPVRIESSNQSTETPKMEKGRMGMRPVASSTPNKGVDFPSPLLPTVTEPVQKRRSLGEEVNRKSRTPDISAGSRQRSNSLKLINSKIPAPAGPRGNSSLALKSTSNLPHTTSFSSPQRAALGDDKNKKSKTSFNPRALVEVKPKPSPKNGRIKGTVKAISSLITGKNKKPASHEKENRFPL